MFILTIKKGDAKPFPFNVKTEKTLNFWLTNFSNMGYTCEVLKVVKRTRKIVVDNQV